MARNKYPEQTVKKILEVSLELFAEKGYDKTTMQDIVSALGMSKGAIYHHFKSKEELLDAVGTYSFQKRNSFRIANQQSNLTGLEKLQNFIMNEFVDSEKQEIDKFSTSLFKEPKMMMKMLEETVKIAAPMLVPMMEEANLDGSAHIEDPKMTAEVFMILVNIWANPTLWDMNKTEFMRKVRTIGSVLNSMGLPLLNEELLDVMQAYADNILPK